MIGLNSGLICLVGIVILILILYFTLNNNQRCPCMRGGHICPCMGRGNCPLRGSCPYARMN